MSFHNNDRRKFFIKTLGCKVNQYESQAMREVLVRSGFNECLAADIADIYILNTCTVTEKADKESRHWITLFHRTNPDAKIVVTGCYADRDASGISFLPGVAHILKNAEKPLVGDILTNAPAGAAAIATNRIFGITDFKGHAKAFVKIQDGCQNACSYCAVPLVRSELVSRPLADIVNEVKTLTERGFREIILTGICIGAWKTDGQGLLAVLAAIDALPGDFRVRLSSIEPRYVTDGLIDFIAGHRRMCRHLHIPLQSGDDTVLARMNRPYTRAEYIALIGKVRAKIEDVAITTDIMIGFPGETEAQFRMTVALVKEILPARVHIFSFSRRKDTPAYAMADEVPKEVVKKRYHELTVASLSASYLYRMRFLGKPLDVLVETKRDKDSSFLTGYSDTYIKVLFEGPDTLMHRMIPVTVTQINLLHTIGTYERT